MTTPSAPQVGPTKLAKLLIFLIIVGAVAGAAWLFRNTLFPSGKGPGGIDLDKFKQMTGQTESDGPEAFDPTGITTVAEYKYVPQERLPRSRGSRPTSGTPTRRWSSSRSTSGSAGCRSSPPTTVSRPTPTRSSPGSTASR
ncbi:MAG: hypothetical protein M5U13_15880 [Thermoanaerobaculia bacterium]|nr:hypothetical protein [Thermoanaerobaculia bacterium]